MMTIIQIVELPSQIIPFAQTSGKFPIIIHWILGLHKEWDAALSYFRPQKGPHGMFGPTSPDESGDLEICTEAEQNMNKM